jgi:hypothetical protein
MSARDASKYLSLSEAIDAVKVELLKADTKARNFDDALFVLKECEIELMLEFEPKVGAEFSLGVFKVSAGAGVKGGHKVTVRFAPWRETRAIANTDPIPGLERGSINI